MRENCDSNYNLCWQILNTSLLVLPPCICSPDPYKWMNGIQNVQILTQSSSLSRGIQHSLSLGCWKQILVGTSVSWYNLSLGNNLNEVLKALKQYLSFWSSDFVLSFYSKEIRVLFRTVCCNIVHNSKSCKQIKCSAQKFG